MRVANLELLAIFLATSIIKLPEIWGYSSKILFSYLALIACLFRFRFAIVERS